MNQSLIMSSFCLLAARSSYQFNNSEHNDMCLQPTSLWKNWGKKNPRGGERGRQPLNKANEEQKVKGCAATIQRRKE